MGTQKPLKLLIERRGHTQSSLARDLGISVSVVNKWCNRGDPRADSLITISQVLKCTADEILGMDPFRHATTQQLLNEVFRRAPK